MVVRQIQVAPWRRWIYPAHRGAVSGEEGSQFTRSKAEAAGAGSGTASLADRSGACFF